MRLIVKSYGIIIVSDRLVTLLSKISFLDGKINSNRAMGFAVFPCFIILRNLDHTMTKQWINHERIHIIQFVESFGLYWLISKLEYVYFRVIKRYSHLKAYRNEAIEQEAYLNQTKSDYIKKREPFSTLKYYKTKTDFTTDANYKVVIIK